jgi:hypothetical protein
MSRLHVLAEWGTLISLGYVPVRHLGWLGYPYQPRLCPGYTSWLNGVPLSASVMSQLHILADWGTLISLGYVPVTHLGWLGYPYQMRVMSVSCLYMGVHFSACGPCHSVTDNMYCFPSRDKMASLKQLINYLGYILDFFTCTHVLYDCKSDINRPYDCRVIVTGSMIVEW